MFLGHGRVWQSLQLGVFKGTVTPLDHGREGIVVLCTALFTGLPLSDQRELPQLQDTAYDCLDEAVGPAAVRLCRIHDAGLGAVAETGHMEDRECDRHHMRVSDPSRRSFMCHYHYPTTSRPNPKTVLTQIASSFSLAEHQSLHQMYPRSRAPSRLE